MAYALDTLKLDGVATTTSIDDIYLGDARYDPWFFFFSSRRRHTSCRRDWSSDVCSSDLIPWGPGVDVLELKGPYRDTRTAIRRDGLEIFLASDSRGRIGGIGSQDLWVS